MALSREEVRRIAALARLRLSPGEEERLAGELSAILDYVRQLEELDVSGVEPMTHALAAGETPFREDAVAPGLSPDEALANAEPTPPEAKFSAPGRARSSARTSAAAISIVVRSAPPASRSRPTNARANWSSTPKPSAFHTPAGPSSAIFLKPTHNASKTSKKRLTTMSKPLNTC